jgi:uncharacterized protein YjbI with pentapeptide repeats
MLGITFSKCSFSSTEFFTVAYHDPNRKKPKAKEMQFDHCNLNGTIFSDSDLDNTTFRNWKLWGIIVYVHLHLSYILMSELSNFQNRF